ncbi:glucose dehydrogenase [Prauserella marina]|uniref:Glucose/arabinose dehydrogenase, beta-propeller fold n=1 Tax=Prauserella marina TaxID=530584 RepID=A0A222VM45_9PSEU|nr:ThuA domain-containing protein [Prauserella marina]ASR34964.1 glucose dehydrogenase [Prauserella marina]PWV85315.1 glucose/arabinose dehydrogenase [Prauserella marina]SDC57697.1 Glucose/arabinose dehydrogenase, beta-propeller fold [Prauserella marina]
MRRSSSTTPRKSSPRYRWRLGAAALALCTGFGGAGVSAAAQQKQAPETQPEQEEAAVLVFSKTAGFRHDSIPAGIEAITQLGAEGGFTVEATEDATAFTDDNLARFDAVVWLSTTGDVLDDEQQGAFERYVAGGGGYAGVHAASDTEYEWPWYGDLVGAYFDSHPHIQEATVAVEDGEHPSTQGLPQEWTRTDEWYNYRDNPRQDVHVLASLDEASYDPGNGAMGDHPIAWCHENSGGRAWYTGGGHTVESFAETEFLQHLSGGIRYAAGLADGDCQPPDDNGGVPSDDDFDQITLAKGEQVTGEPIAIAVLPDRRVLHTSRDGRVFLTTPEATTTVAATIPVYNHDEDGLQGIAVDPGFEDNRWVYLYYAPPLDTPQGDAPENGTEADFAPFKGYNQLSRYQLTEEGTLDLDSEQQIMRVDAERGICCHAGGEIDFDAEGNLLLSTGDDTNPFASDGYTPIDERADRNPVFDGQRSSANTNDLRGKLLRIKVGEDGGYTIPEGNLFAEGTDKTRPEIYAMGFRNPFRFAVDKETGWIYLGDYGPDAGSANPNRGPGGMVEFNLIKEPGNFGWPYCVGDNVAYNDYDFATGASGELFDCAAPKNESPHNTGLVDLPPAQPAWIPYDGGSVPEFGTGGESPMGGPVYRFDPELDSLTKFPEYYDGKNFAYEWDRGWIKEITVGPDGERGDIAPFFDSMTLTRPMNIEFGPDGSLYVLDYGSGYFGGAADSAVYRIDYTKGNRTPQVQLSADTTSGPGPLEVTFDPSGTTDPDGDELSYEWDFDGDGTTDSTEAGPVTHTYGENGQYQARLAVTDETGLTGAASVTITVGNTEPAVTLETPVNGGFFGFGDSVPFKVTVTDPEDGEIDCSKVTVEYILGHDNHGHPLSRATGCEGVISTPADEGHGLDADIFGIIDASYTDNGAEGVPALTGSDQNILQPKLKQAEFFSDHNGVQVVEGDGASGGKRVGYIDDGDWIEFDPANLSGIEAVGYRVSSGGAGGQIELRSGAPDGPVLHTVDVANTGSFDDYVDLDPVAVTDPGGTQPLYLVFKGTGVGGLFDVDAVNFAGSGVAEPGTPPSCEPGQPQEGYSMLFDGTEDSMASWNQAGPGSFEFQDDCTIRSTGGMGLYWFEQEFSAYSLKLDWKMAGDDNSGVFVGFPDPGDDPWVAVNEGYEIQIDATDADDRTTGSIYTFQSADIEARDAALNPPGEWNAYEIVVQGQTIKVYLNDVLINDFVSTDPARDLTNGFVGIQNHGDGDDVSFRNIQIKELDVTPPVTEASFSEPGTGGWHQGEVPVTLEATDEGSGVERIEWRLGDGEWTTYSEPVVISGDGEHSLLYRAVDVAGNVEADKAATVSIDGTKPTVMVAGVAEGRVYGDASDLVVSWLAGDATSGIARQSASLDGEPVASGTVVPLHQLPLGLHSLNVTATDNAGNTAEQTVAFASTTSLRDIGQLVDRFRASNRLSLPDYVSLSSQVAKIRKAEANGNDVKAVKELRKFADAAGEISDQGVASTLVRDARAVIEHIEGVAPLRLASNGS